MMIANRFPRSVPTVRERGVVLVVALVVLAAMTLAAVTLMRSSLTTHRVSGNLAFQQAAAQSAEAGIEQAIAWLEANNNGALSATVSGMPAYLPAQSGPDLAAHETWESYWNNVLVQGHLIYTLPANTIPDYTVAYVIHRMCNASGDPAVAGCSQPPVSANSLNNSHGSGSVNPNSTSQIYYRITVRVSGPRQTVGFVQAIVAL